MLFDLPSDRKWSAPGIHPGRRSGMLSFMPEMQQWMISSVSVNLRGAK